MPRVSSGTEERCRGSSDAWNCSCLQPGRREGSLGYLPLQDTLCHRNGKQSWESQTHDNDNPCEPAEEAQHTAEQKHTLFNTLPGVGFHTLLFHECKQQQNRTPQYKLAPKCDSLYRFAKKDRPVSIPNHPGIISASAPPSSSPGSQLTAISASQARPKFLIKPKRAELLSARFRPLFP